MVKKKGFLESDVLVFFTGKIEIEVVKENPYGREGLGSDILFVDEKKGEPSFLDGKKVVVHQTLLDLHLEKL